ncbi:Hypothetical predicted protein [Olea europaea subsp. europaea]|uniref:Uncharacterized protein n=1 Tax=Olea europaea subsp. europaea TaxID=158383 RepID=A0A8S0S7H6_OLEEU|nr:Hypothetical predicted protein [Olea europaea subsp. europaea]
MWKICFCITSCKRSRNDDPESKGFKSSESGKRRSKSTGIHEKKEKDSSLGVTNYTQLDSGGRAANTDAGTAAAAVVVVSSHLSDMSGSACGSSHGGGGGDGC